MKQVFVTSAPDSGSTEYSYAQKFIDSFLLYTPYELTYYYDGTMPESRDRLISKALIHTGLNKLRVAASQYSLLRGMVDGIQYNYRYNALGFAHKVFCQYLEFWRHFDESNPVQLIWMDSDIVVHQPIPPSLFEDMQEYDICYLGRKGWHTCTSFISYVLGGRTLPFIDYFANLYINGYFLLSKEWTDAYLFDRCIEAFTGTYPLSFHNLGSDVRGAGPYNVFNDVFNPYMTHLKGNLKYI